MIIIDIPDLTPMVPPEGLAIRKQGEILVSISAQDNRDFNLCCVECKYYETVFADLLDNANYKNDTSDFKFQKVVAADTIEYKLYKEGVKVADLNDDTYGTLYDGFTDAPLYVWFEVDWSKVLTGLGAGNYSIKVERTIMGSTLADYESRPFLLLAYSDQAANGTVKIETYQTGNIKSSEFDYSLVTADLPNGWHSSIRIEGFFGLAEPSIETTEYQTAKYEYEQVQDKVSNTYSLETGLLPGHISDIILYDNIIANRFVITDYNIYNIKIYRELELRIKEIPESKYFPSNTKSKYLIKFIDKIDNIIKTNF